MPRKRKLDTAAATNSDGEKEEAVCKEESGRMITRKRAKTKENGAMLEKTGDGTKKPENAAASRTTKKAKKTENGEKTAEKANTTKRTTEKKETTKRKEDSGSKRVVPKRSEEQPSAVESSESEWEDVADHPSDNFTADGAGTSSSSGSIQITVNAPKTQKQLDLEGEIRRAIKRFRNEFQENLHKAHLLTFIAYGRRLSTVCNDELNMATSLSMVPVGYTGIGKDKRFGKSEFKRFVKWFHSGFEISGVCGSEFGAVPRLDLTLEIRSSLQNRAASNSKIMTLCFVTTVRALGLDCRVVFNSHPISRKQESNVSGEDKKTATVTRTRSTAKEPRTEDSSSMKRPKKKTKAVESEDDDDEEEKERGGTVSKGTRSSSGQKGSACLTSKSAEQNEKDKEKSKNKASSAVGTSKLSKIDLKSEEIECEYWAEVYLETVEQWLCVDCVQGVVDDLEAIRNSLTAPVIYCLSFDRDNALKDVTSRYSPDFMSTQTRRLRVQQADWLSKTFALFRSTKRLRNRLEDMQLEGNLSKQALPTSLGEYKNHPLYVLKKDLKKFEGIYPADIKPIGFIRNEPVYPRSSVHMLHSKDQWRKEALVVKDNEEPFKIVKGRPKWNASTQEKVDDREVPLYGKWQTEPYKPKAAKDGIVPRNEYGNVELFKMSMLPPGTVYLELPGLLNVAKKIDIDCAPAMIGWEFHGRSSHPVLNGWVVCEEYKDVLTAAWEEEQEILKKRDEERRSKRALQNWRRFIKAALLRQKLHRKFKTGLPVELSGGVTAEEEKGEGSKNQSSIEKEEEAQYLNGSEEAVGTSSLSWPQCRHEFTGGNHEEQLK